jgi:Na+-transporting methylmalonyl-CoA/oxaloacetate decarboxylase gamma subunit
MNGFMLLQVSQSVAQKSAEMLEKDPHGAIITLVSVSVVFVALIILFFAYTFIGKLSSGQISLKLLKRKPKHQSVAKGAPSPEEAAAIALALDHEMNGEAYAAIGMASHQYLNDTVHDIESYIITIRRK